MKIAVVYYSMTGHTETLANAIATEADVEAQPIVDAEARQRLGGALTSVWQTLVGSPSPINYPAVDPGHLDLLIIGGPMWVGRPCAPLQTYLRSLQDDGIAVAFFMTTGASNAKRAFKRMAKLCGKEPVATLALTEDELADGIDSWQLKDFVRQATDRLPVEAAA